MGTETMGRVTVAAKIENVAELFLSREWLSLSQSKFIGSR